MRSPEQEQRVVMSLYNRFCVRCHGIDGRGVCGIPDVPDFTDPRWQASRPDSQIVHIVMAGRGACMPSFRGTVSLEEAWALARYLRTFVPGTELLSPEVGRAFTRGPEQADLTALPPLPTAGRPFASPPR
jgi:mono/diheme cytochrome c family protein